MGRFLTWLPLILMLAVAAWLLSGWNERKDSTAGSAEQGYGPAGQEGSEYSDAIRSGLR